MGQKQLDDLYMCTLLYKGRLIIHKIDQREDLGVDAVDGTPGMRCYLGCSHRLSDDNTAVKLQRLVADDSRL